MDGMQWMGSAMRAARGALDVAAHNLANAGSDGFRRTQVRFSLTPTGIAERSATVFEQGGVRASGGRFDCALLGPGHFLVGGSPTRNGAFVRDRDGWLTDGRGGRVAGTRGDIRVSPDARIGADGSVLEGARVVNAIALPQGTTIRSGALEASNVDSIGETLAILSAQRAFETAQKTFVAIDETRQKSVNDVVRLK